MARRVIAFVFMLVAWPLALASGAMAAEANQAFGMLALDADRYLQDIRIEHGGASDLAASEAALKEAATRVKAQDWASAADAYERAVAAGADDAATWTALAEALDHLDRREDAAAAAYSAYLATDGYQARAQALFRLGAVLERANRLREAAQAYRAGLDQAYDEKAADRLQALESVEQFRATAINVDQEGDKPRVCVEFHGELSDDPAVRWQDYVKIKPEFDAAYSVSGSTLCIDGVAFGATYQVTLLAGLPGLDGDRLAGIDTFTVTVGDREPSVGFRGAAYVLPKVGSTGVPMVSVNVTQAKIELLRITDRSLVREIYDGKFLRALDGYEARQIAESYGDAIWTGRVDIESEKNRQVVTSIPIGEVLPQTRPGVYILTAQPADAPESEWQTRATQWLIVTDYGITSYSGRDGLHVAVRSLDTGRPIAGADVRLYARDNEELGRSTTDATGLALFAPGLLRGSAGRTATAVMVFGQSGEFSFLDLTHAAFDLSDRGVGGRMAPGPIDAFLYTDRGVYRPGETVQLMALLRDQLGRAQPDLPLTLRFIRPDGVEAERRMLTGGSDAGFHIPFAIAANARTGTWTAEAYVDPDGKPVGETSFLVEEIVPRRIEVKLATEARELSAGAGVQVAVDAKFLYGAPAAGLPVKGEVVVGVAADPYPMHPGFTFTLADEPVEATRTPLADTMTDENGQVALDFAPVSLPDTPQPLDATLRVEVYEFGGRPVVETLTLPVRNHDRAVGIKPLFADGEVPEGGSAGFEVVAVAPDGTPVAAQGLRYTLIREDWDYQWFYRDGSWDYEIIVRDQPVSTSALDVAADAPARIDQAVQWGPYRLEVYDPQSGAAASVRFYAGWAAKPGLGDTPDTLKVAADKPLYQAGETAHVRLKPPFAGPILVAIATDTIIETREIDATPEGVSLDLPVDGSWGAGAYVLATAFRPGQAQGRGPGRAIGVAWLGIDSTPHALTVSLQAPAEAAPRQPVDIPVQVSGIAPGETAHVTLAAVDEGILQITDFTTPDPLDHYFGKRRLGVEIRDLYGRLIDGREGRRGKIREGGDEGALAKRGAPPPTALVALFSGIVALDAEGRATVPLAIPDYNGRLRLMAVAYDATHVGSVEAPLVVRDPLVTTLAMPRFMAPGDTAQITLSLQNLSAPAGRFDVALSAEGGVSVGEGATAEVNLTAGASMLLHAVLKGEAPGAGHLALAVTGPEGYRLERSFDIFVRPAQLATVDRVARRLAPGESLNLGSAVTGRYIPGTGEVLASFSALPNLDVPGLLRQLDRYPYGCLEQTVSRALPLLYVGEVSRLWGAGGPEDDLKPRIQQAINRTLAMQRYDGSFGLWGPGDEAEPWLSAYAMDFYTRARRLGYGVPDAAYARGLDWLRHHSESYYADSQDELGSRAYALLVLAEAQTNDAGTLRYFHDNYARRLPTALAAAQLGAALALNGDEVRAAEAFGIAQAKLERQRRDLRDYGSPLRDLAATATLMIEARYAGQDPAPLIERAAVAQQERQWLSTQEEGWLLMAAAASVGSSRTMTLAVNGATQPERSEPLYLRPSGEELAAGLSVRNAGADTVWARATVIGVPQDPLPPAGSGYTIERKFYDLAGAAVDLGQVRQTDLLVAVITGHKQSELAQQTLVVDLLPPGFEVENAHLAGAQTTDQLGGWLPELTPTAYSEFLDDRYVAALDLKAGAQDFAVAYIVRAVTPGTYSLPAAAVEAMYQPELRARTGMGTVTIRPY